MENFNQKLNLMKLEKSGIVTIQGRGEVLKCLVIPVEANHLFVSTDENNKPKGVYLDLCVWKIKNPRYEETHMIKQSLPKEVRDDMTEEQRNSMPILGGMKPMQPDALNNEFKVDAPYMQTEGIDDLPF